MRNIVARVTIPVSVTFLMWATTVHILRTKRALSYIIG
jgi:hypothetical protein